MIAVGTTVVRALESAAAAGGKVLAGHGYTRLRITASHKLQAVDGLLTGLHEPAASHLDLLTAFLPAERIRSAYEEAVRLGYLWHEFGDLNLRTQHLPQRRWYTFMLPPTRRKSNPSPPVPAVIPQSGESPLWMASICTHLSGPSGGLKWRGQGKRVFVHLHPAEHWA